MKYPKTKKGLNKSILITGATSGIGREIAIKFAREGWNIICHYFSSLKSAKELKQEIEKYNVDCRLIGADLSSKRQLMSFIKKVEGLKIDALVNNAGTYVANKYFGKLSIDDIEKAFMVNSFSPMLLSSKIFVRMKERNFGRIINISSIAAKYGGSSYSMHYGCSKRALEGLTKTLAKEGAAYNVLVNTVRPGVIDTEFHRKFPKDMGKRIKMIPLKRMGTPRDIAEMAYYLGSEKNDFITNEIITIAGGE
ncbi:MAG: hypothetical protein AMJ78_01125 [Omnitrophica WOR_2 bacterium SM23_29]|nr:MAG: hypothetical protein AMJ78_01125 [Omnitrophica WOR_2 bacterium SM23_29]